MSKTFNEEKNIIANRFCRFYYSFQLSKLILVYFLSGAGTVIRNNSVNVLGRL